VTVQVLIYGVTCVREPRPNHIITPQINMPTRDGWEWGGRSVTGRLRLSSVSSRDSDLCAFAHLQCPLGMGRRVARTLAYSISADTATPRSLRPYAARTGRRINT
jgi:hypothetical protein